MSDASGRGFGYWLSIFANVAVVAGIVFLGLELRQNTRMMRAQTRNEIAQSVLGILESERAPGLAGAMQRGMDRSEPLPEDAYLLGNYARSILRLWENMHYQYRSGLFDEEELGAEMVAWERFSRERFLIDFWQSYRQEYAPSFRAVMDSLIEYGQETP